MTFLPIVARELRVAARKRSTFWLRVIASLVALLLGCGFLLLTRAGVFPSAGLGAVLFGIVTWMALAAALSAGLFFTSDCLSEEKRDGTLGFLFLTDLRGYDVVLGKLLATSLRGCFALLAVLPILAITILMGGVNGTQFWKTALALVNALFCSLAVGMLISALSRDPQKAMAAVFFFLLSWAFAGMLTDAIRGKINHHGFSALWSLSSPLYAFATAGGWGRTPYWTALYISHLIGWLALGLASLLLPRTWQEKAGRKNAALSSWSYALRYGGTTRRAALRRKLIDRNPILWLACRERWQSMGIWTMAVVVAISFIALVASDLRSEIWIIWRSVGLLFTAALYLWAASQAGRFFLEAAHPFTCLAQTLARER